MFSFANAENVVNPPQNPVAISRVKFVELELFLFANPRMIPMSKHPKIFIVKVLHGNIEFDLV